MVGSSGLVAEFRPPLGAVKLAVPLAFGLESFARSAPASVRVTAYPAGVTNCTE